MNNKERLFLSKVANNKLRAMEKGMMKTWGRPFSGGTAGGAGFIAPPNSSIDRSQLKYQSHLPGVSNKPQSPIPAPSAGFRDYNVRDTSGGIPRLTSSEIQSLKAMRQQQPPAPVKSTPPAPPSAGGSNQLAFNVKAPGQFTPSAPR